MNPTIQLVEHVSRLDVARVVSLPGGALADALTRGWLEYCPSSRLWVRVADGGLRLLRDCQEAEADKRRASEARRASQKRSPDYEIALGKAQAGAELLQHAQSGMGAEARQAVREVAAGLLKDFCAQDTPPRYQAQAARLKAELERLV